MSQEQFDRDHRGTLGHGRDRLANAFRSDSAVTAVGIGYRTRGGEPTDEPVVIAAVAKKRPDAHVARTRLLPKHVDIDGRRYGVDVIEAGPFRVGPAVAGGEPMVRNAANTAWQPLEPPIIDQLRPALQGAQIANEAGIGAGTFGCLVRDRTDGTLCLLSNNHVLANINASVPGTRILQPGFDLTETIANLKRYVPLGFSQATAGLVDCAIAQVTDPALVSKNIALGLMPPISSQHKAVGLLFAGDSYANILMCDFGQVLGQLNVELLPTDAARSATLGMNVDKVGRTTRYTASKVVGLDFTVEIQHGRPDLPAATYWIRGAHLVANAGWAGDSGSVICAGGNADRPVYAMGNACFAFPIIPDMYDLPATATAEFGDRIRDEFLALTPVGRLLVQVLYLNSQTVISRTTGVEASDPEKIYANNLYTKYRTFMEDALNNPDDPRFVFTQQHYDDTNQALYGFSLRATREEADAANKLYTQVLKRAIGMSYRQLLAFMSDVAVYNEVYNILAVVPGVVMRERATA